MVTDHAFEPSALQPLRCRHCQKLRRYHVRVVSEEASMSDRLSDQALQARAADTLNKGGARAAGYLLAVPYEEREVRETAGTIFGNISPGWRYADAIGHACRASLAWCERIVAEERARAARERELRRQGHQVVVYSDGSIGHYGSDMIVNRVTREV